MNKIREAFSKLEGVFSEEEKGRFNIGKLDDSVMEIALLRHKI